jgi:hypothetical protein
MRVRYFRSLLSNFQSHYFTAFSNWFQLRRLAPRYSRPQCRRRHPLAGTHTSRAFKTHPDSLKPHGRVGAQPFPVAASFSVPRQGQQKRLTLGTPRLESSTASLSFSCLLRIPLKPRPAIYPFLKRFSSAAAVYMDTNMYDLLFLLIDFSKFFARTRYVVVISQL